LSTYNTLSKDGFGFIRGRPSYEPLAAGLHRRHG
jgi:hypothetical protein